MQQQSYKNHIRFYPAHHFVYYPVLGVFLTAAVYFSFISEEHLLWIFISSIFIFLFWLAFMLRQHYALILQNRIVRLEMRYRYFVLTGNRFESIEYQITDAQLFALRFAPDEELMLLIDKTIHQNLSSKEIKKSIVNWNGDYHRV